MGDEEIGPWIGESRPPSQKSASRKRASKCSNSRQPSRASPRRTFYKSSRATHTVHASPVYFQSPELMVYTPPRPRHPFSPPHFTRAKMLNDNFGLYLQQWTRPMTAAVANFDITSVKKTILRLNRAPKRNVSRSSPERPTWQREKSGFRLETGCGNRTSEQFCASDAVNWTQLRTAKDSKKQGEVGPVPASRQYRRRVKVMFPAKLTDPDYDYLAENLSEQLHLLTARRPKTSGLRSKVSAHREASKDALSETLSQIVDWEK